MTTYLITYDLHEEKSYRAIADAILKLDRNCTKALLSTWIINSHLTDVEVRDALLLAVDYDDEILVIEVARRAAWRIFSQEVRTWLATHLA